MRNNHEKKDRKDTADATNTCRGMSSKHKS